MAAPCPRVLVAGTSFGFPYGQGAATRVYMYAKALQAAGAEVHVASLALPEKGESARAEPASGIYDSITYEYACGTRVRPRSFARRRLLRLRRLSRLCDLTLRMSRGSPGASAILIYSNSSLWVTTLTLLARVSGAVAILDLCEYPRPGGLGSVRATLQRAGQRALLYPALDGIVPISTFLEKYVATGPRPPATLLVPVMVDTDLFGPEAGSAAAGRQIVYCGALGRYAEVERVVRSFAQAVDGMPDVSLVLVGYGPAAPVARAEALVRSLGLQKRVTFAGDVRREDLPGLLAAAEVFVLPRPPSVISVAGLPNKLGEYLAAARPVVANANGDIPRYLDDGVSAYFADPGDEAAFTARLRYVLEHREEAVAVGRRGRDVAVREFDYRRHGTRLAAFITSLVAARDRGADG